MSLPDKIDLIALKVRPYSVKLLIGFGFCIVVLMKGFFLPIIEGEEPSATWIKLSFATLVISMWCFGLFMLAKRFGAENESKFAKAFPSVASLGRWFSAIFVSVWFGFLVLCSLIVPIVLLKN